MVLGKIVKLTLSMSCWGVLVFVATATAANYLPVFSDIEFMSQADDLMHRFSMAFGGWLNDSVLKPGWPRFFREMLEIPIIGLCAVAPAIMPAPSDLKGMWLFTGPAVLFKFLMLAFASWAFRFGDTYDEQASHFIGIFYHWLRMLLRFTPRELFQIEMTGLVLGVLGWGLYHFMTPWLDKAFWAFIRIIALLLLFSAGPTIVLEITWLAAEETGAYQGLMQGMEAWWEMVLSGEQYCVKGECV